MANAPFIQFSVLVGSGGEKIILWKNPKWLQKKWSLMYQFGITCVHIQQSVTAVMVWSGILVTFGCIWDSSLKKRTFIPPPPLPRITPDQG